MLEIQRADSPSRLAGWDDLTRSRSFYTSAPWLHYADAGVATTPRYYLARPHDLPEAGPVAALVAHWTPDEAPEYIAGVALGISGAPRCLTLGGRRAYCSGVLCDGATPDAASNLAPLISAALGDSPEADSHWWWPYLTTADANVVRDAARSASPRPVSVHLIGGDCVVDVIGTDVWDQVERLPSQQRRTNARHDLRSFAASGLQVREVDLLEHAERFGDLLAQVQRKYGHEATGGQMAALLRRQGQMLGEHAVALACLEGAQIVAFSLLYRWHNELALRVIGFDYARATGAGVYAELSMWAPLRWAQSHDVHRLHLGIDSYAAKLRRGARIRAQWAVTTLPPPAADRVQVVVSGLGLPRTESEQLLDEARAGLTPTPKPYGALP